MAQIDLKKVSRYYGKKKAVDNISLSINKGEIFGLLGPNGAGKTTLISMITTQLLPSSGFIKIGGYNTVSNGKKVREQIGAVFQEVLLDGDLTAFKNLDIHARLYKMSKAERINSINTVLSLCDLKTEKNNKLSNFSGGMKRKLEIARGLLSNPKILLLDEPTLNLDPIAKKKVWDHIMKINKSKRTTVVIATNDMHEAEVLCDRIAVIHRGKLLIVGNIFKIKKTMKQKSLTDVFVKLIQNVN